MQKFQYVFMALAALCFAVPAFAQNGGGSAAINLVPIGAGIGMALAADFAASVRARQLLRLAKHWLATPAHAAD